MKFKGWVKGKKINLLYKVDWVASSWTATDFCALSYETEKIRGVCFMANQKNTQQSVGLKDIERFL